MDCKSVKKLIQIFLDGELPDTKRKFVVEHLATCGECRREVEALKSTMVALDAWPTIESRLTYADFKAKAGTSQQKSWLPIWKPVPQWAAACMVLIALLGGIVSGEYHAQRNIAHTHKFTAQMTQASESLGLDAFNGGLQEALYKPATGSSSVEVR